MSSRNKAWDDRYTVELPQGGTILVGHYGGLVSSGANWQLGEPPSQPHAYSIDYWDRGDSYYRLERNAACGPGLSEIWGLCQASARPERDWTSNDDLELYGKLRKKYDDSDFNAPIFVGELGEAADMLAGNLYRLARAGLMAKRGHFREALDTLRKKAPKKRGKKLAKGRELDGLSQRWLELQYGWKPLVEDISNLADFIASNDRPRTTRKFARQFIFMKPYCNYGNLGASGGGKMQKQIIAYVSEDRPSPPERLGMLDPAVVAWELMPFSFVADWVYPIGDYLEARAFARRAKGTFVITKKTRYNARVGGSYSKSYDPSAFSCYVPQTDVMPLCWEQRVLLERTIWPSLPSVDLPTFKNPLGLSGKKLANAVALVVSVFAGNKR